MGQSGGEISAAFHTLYVRTAENGTPELYCGPSIVSDIRNIIFLLNFEDHVNLSFVSSYSYYLFSTLVVVLIKVIAIRRGTGL